jgi:hypothetical protein
MTNDPLEVEDFSCSDSPLFPEPPFASDDCVVLDCASNAAPVDSGKFCWALATPIGDVEAHSPAHKIQRVQRNAVLDM